MSRKDVVLRKTNIKKDGKAFVPGISLALEGTGPVSRLQAKDPTLAALDRRQNRSTLAPASKKKYLCRVNNMKKKYYHKDTEPLFHYFMYSLVSHFFLVPAMHSLLVTSDVRSI